MKSNNELHKLKYALYLHKGNSVLLTLEQDQQVIHYSKWLWV